MSGDFLSCVLPYFLGTGFHIEPQLTNLAGMSGQQAQRPHVSILSVRRLQTCTSAAFVHQAVCRDLSLDLHTRNMLPAESHS